MQPIDRELLWKCKFVYFFTYLLLDVLYLEAFPVND